MIFKDENKFEDAMINLLVKEKGWSGGVIEYPTEEDLIHNWADILFKINNEVDKLNGVPLNEGEITQLMNQINMLQTPNKRNEFINGKYVTITRENEDDKLHYGREISLKIFDRNEIAAGSSIYQIARQPKFAREDPVERDRRGDFMLLINGLPVIHVELKRSGVAIEHAIQQIKTYMHENKFRGLFSLIQIFIAMNPDDMKYFANPGADDVFNDDYYFYWADFNNEITVDWKTVCSEFLSIPMAHQLLGYYTVADTKDGVLKVMRSYQIYATREIVDRVREKQKNSWSIKDQLGGYIWHTTGSGKTMTSFKSAELIAQLGYCDKVIFLIDRITLADQTVKEFEGFSNYEEIFETENTDALLRILTDNEDGRLIVTSIQKMSNLVDGVADSRKLEQIKNKRIVFIVDEAHRSTFGTMMIDIKNTYQNAVFFGFTGTPIHTKTENTDSTELTTADIFGSELHRYTLADGIRDGNVLAFDITKVETIPAMELRKKYALYKAHVKSVEELVDDERAYKIYKEYMDPVKHPMVEIDKNLGNGPYETSEHKEKVVKNILESWVELNRKNKFSAIFATSSIKDAIEYWRLLKDNPRNLKVTCVFDSSDDFTEFSIEKNDGLRDIITHYNDMYGKSFTISTHGAFRADVSKRLAKKEQYIDLKDEDKIDVVIVVYQLLTGYDSKWVSILYLDKILEMQNLIQGFSRTNRLNGPEKPHGTIRYYRKTSLMEQNIKDAVQEYSGDKPYIMYVDKLPDNIRAINRKFDEIKGIFNLEKIKDFSRLPESDISQEKFVKCFNELYECLNSAFTQGFRWNKNSYADTENKTIVEVEITEKEYNTLIVRYQEINKGGGGGNNGGSNKPNIHFNYHIIEESFKIDYNYMNENFNKYIKVLGDVDYSEGYTRDLKASLHKNFASLPKERQETAEMIINDLENGDLEIKNGWDFNDYINSYSESELDKQISELVNFTNVDEGKLRELINLNLTEKNLDEYGRYDSLVNSCDLDLITANLSNLKGSAVKPYKSRIYLDKILRKFLLEDPFSLKEYNEYYKDSI
ncbi:HsdR family type I site-specific deoxyribonuclease [Finegoldia magna]|uniref:HsdR family type I site-specific deoxyribonuclease n=1 Tax=Finegoldia magna TaxID=1260 RepID=UPI001CE042D8|nr:HsdR family type I site-specific deoxyribonuclease [Finegoldia magna]MCA5587120.1 HsdR family type I site-specific deoxyribonuclease [Finegoldia magna]